MTSWTRIDVDMYADIKLRKANARAIWPCVLCRLGAGGGSIDPDDLDPAIVSDDHDGDISEARAAEMLESIQTLGLLVLESGRWTSPRWRNQPTDPTSAARQQRFRDRSKARAAVAP